MLSACLIQMTSSCSDKTHLGGILQALKNEKEMENQRYTKRMQELDVQIARIGTHYAKAHNAQLPVLLLPEEISLVIFRYTSYAWHKRMHRLAATEPNPGRIDNGRDDGDDDQSSATKSPSEIVISHVCRAWRAIALTSPEMWCSFASEAYLENVCPGSKAIHSFLWLSAYLERSQNFPFTLALWAELGNPQGKFKGAISDLLPPHTSRLRQLTISLTCIDDLKAFTSLEATSANNLEKLEVVTDEAFCDEEIPDSAQSSLYANKCATKLSVLRVPCDFLEFCLPTTSNITILQVDSTSRPYTATTWATFLSIFQLPSLASLSVERLSVQYPSNLGENAHPIVAAHLRHFRCADINILCYVLTALSAPCLELINLSKIQFNNGLDDLTWRFPFDAQGAPIGPNQALEYFPEMQTLSFSDCSIYPEANILWKVLARATRTATHIMVASYMPTWPLNLLVDHADEALWPNLTTISHSIRSEDSSSETVRSAGIDLLKLMKRRASHVKKHCRHQVEEAHLSLLQRELGNHIWELLVDDTLYDVVPIATQDTKYWVPWPPRQAANFHDSSELSFNY